MNRLQRAAVLTALADELRKRGSWCGETHLQKATYFLQSLLGVPLGYEFILYKHGPYSFDLHDELTALCTDQLLELRPQPYPYGPSLLPTAASADFRRSTSGPSAPARGTGLYRRQVSRQGRRRPRTAGHGPVRHARTAGRRRRSPPPAESTN